MIFLKEDLIDQALDDFLICLLRDGGQFKRKNSRNFPKGVLKYFGTVDRGIVMVCGQGHF